MRGLRGDGEDVEMGLPQMCRACDGTGWTMEPDPEKGAMVRVMCRVCNGTGQR